MSPEERSSLDFIQRSLAAIGTPRVLVVEDDEDDLLINLNVLKKFQCEILVARTVNEAVRFIKGDGIDLIFLDAKLPGGMSEDVISTAVGMKPESNVIMVTGYPYSETRSLAIRKGAKVILPKPLTEEPLSAILQRKTG